MHGVKRRQSGADNRAGKMRGRAKHMAMIPLYNNQVLEIYGESITILQKGNIKDRQLAGRDCHDNNVCRFACLGGSVRMFDCLTPSERTPE